MDEELEALEIPGGADFEEEAQDADYEEDAEGGFGEDAPDRFSEAADEGGLEEALIDVDGELVPLAALGGAAPTESEGRLEPYLELLERYPELRDPARLPGEAAEAIRRGANPVVAYQDYLLRQQAAQQQAALQRDSLRARCPGSAAGYGDGVTDGAFAAFDEVLNGYY